MLLTGCCPALPDFRARSRPFRLADEVGMGKTVVCIALILANPADGAKVTSSADVKVTLTAATAAMKHGRCSWLTLVIPVRRVLSWK